MRSMCWVLLLLLLLLIVLLLRAFIVVATLDQQSAALREPVWSGRAADLELVEHANDVLLHAFVLVDTLVQAAELALHATVLLAEAHHLLQQEEPVALQLLNLVAHVLPNT